MNGFQSHDRRKCRRYPLLLPIRYRVAPRNEPAMAGSGTTCDISPGGLSFLCRDALPVGSHIEMVVQWPAKTAGRLPLDLRMTGFVVRSSQAGVAVRVTSHKLCADAAPALPYRVSA